MVIGLAHGGISTRDMEKSIDFYTRLLGGRVIMEIEEPKGTPWIVAVQFPDGSCVELFYPRPEQFPLGTALGRNHLAFRVEDIQALHRLLLDEGVPVTVAPRVARDGNLQMWCTDPNNYPVEFLQYVPDCPQLKSGPVVKLS
mgnify:CR=1 FL=1